MKKTKISFTILVLLVGSSSLLGQKVKKTFDFNSHSPKDTVVYYIEGLIASGSIIDFDSNERAEIYMVLDSMQLNNYSLELIEQEINITPKSNYCDLLNFSTQKAFMLMRTGSYDKAHLLFIRNIDQSFLVNEEMLIPNYGGLATLFFNQSELDSCLKYTNLFFNSAIKFKDSVNIAEALKIKGNAFFSNANYTSALKAHKQCIPYCDSLRLGSAYNEIGRDFFYLNQFDSAFKYLHSSLYIKKAIGDTYGYCASLGNLGQLYLYYGDEDAALEYFEECTELASDEEYIDLLAWMQKSKSSYYSKKNDYKKALQYYKSYSLLNESLLTEKSDIRFAVEKAKSNAANQQYFLSNLKKQNKIERLKSLRLTYIIIALSLAIIASALIIALLRLRNQKKSLELKQQLGRAQMNPHFIFNALNLLQQNILKGDIKSSNKFLSKFSHLVRNTLESSNKVLVSIEDEINFLENYLAMEAMRFEQQFEFNITTDQNIDSKHCKIPSMVIQPFVENAIWHGLLQKASENKKLSISLTNKTQYILCEIRDNGIGLSKSKELKSGKKQAKKSLGIEITQKRLENLSKIYKSSFKFKIEELKEEQAIAGTLVSLQFPILA